MRNFLGFAGASRPDDREGERETEGEGVTRRGRRVAGSRPTDASRIHTQELRREGTMKVSDKIKERVERGEQFFSFEFFPPRTEEVRGAAQRPANEREAFGGWGEGEAAASRRH